MESFFQRPELSGGRQTTDGAWIVRVEAIGNLIPGGSAQCRPVYFDGTNWKANTKIKLTVFDPFARVCALTGERFWAIWRPDMSTKTPDHLETLGEFGISPRFAQVITTLPASGGGFGVVELLNSAYGDLGLAVSAVALTGYPIGVGTFVSVFWDRTLGRWYTPDRQAVLLGDVSGTSINAGATGSVVVKDDQGNVLLTQNNVRAISLLVRSQKVALVFDYVKAEWFAFPLNTPSICQATAAIAYQGTGTINILDATKANAGGVLTQVSGYAFYRAIAKDEFCLAWWDYYAGKFFLVPLSGVGALFGRLMGSTSIAKGATGTIDLYDDQLSPLGTTLANVRALIDLVKYDYVQLFWDSTNNEFYAVPMGRPCIAKPTADITKGNDGSADLYDSGVAGGAAPAALGVSRNVIATFGKLIKGQFCVSWWDWKQQQFYGMQAPVGTIYAHMACNNQDLATAGVDFWTNTFSDCANGITVDTANNKLVIVTKGIYLAIIRCAVRAGITDETDFHAAVNWPADYIDNTNVQFHSAQVLIPTHINLATGNPDTYNTYEPPDRSITKFGTELLDVGDEIKVDQFTFGVSKKYDVELFLILLEPAG